jgi:hypothetical protein
MRLTRKSRFILAGVTALAITGGTAFAFWTQGGSGTGTATTGTTNNIVVKQTSVSANTLYPGGPAENLSGNFNNPNSGPVTISSVTALVTSVSPAACTSSNFTIGGSAAGSVVPAGTGVGAWSGLTISLAETGVNQDVCKNATATITYTANA